MNVPRIAAVALAAASFICTPSARAQADTARVNTVLWTACPGATVQIGVVSGDTVRGRCGAVADGRLLVQTSGTTREVALAEVRSLSLRRSRLPEATLLLTLAGAVLGSVAGFGEEPCEPVCLKDTDNVRARGAAVGAVIGAAAGLILGPQLTRWEQHDLGPNSAHSP